MPLFDIPVIEFNSAHGAPGPGVPQPVFTFNDRQLTIGMVRSILTRHPGKAARRYMAAIVRPTLVFVLDWNRLPELTLNPTFPKLVRDFSVTGRVGELAQAIAYSYFRLATPYRDVADFSTFALARGIVIPAGAKTPDYLMLDPVTGDVAIMESKGTQRANPRNQITQGLRQIRAAMNYAPGHRGISSVLALDHPTGRGTLYLRDPQGKLPVTDEIRYDIFRSSYASWFDLQGDEEMAELCRMPFGTVNAIPNKSGMLKNSQRSSKNDPLQKVIADALGFKPDKVKFHLDERVADALIDPISFQSLKHNQPTRSTTIGCEEPGSAMLFPDGTEILPD